MQLTWLSSVVLDCHFGNNYSDSGLITSSLLQTAGVCRKWMHSWLAHTSASGSRPRRCRPLVAVEYISVRFIDGDRFRDRLESLEMTMLSASQVDKYVLTFLNFFSRLIICKQLINAMHVICSSNRVSGQVAHRYVVRRYATEKQNRVTELLEKKEESSIIVDWR